MKLKLLWYIPEFIAFYLALMVRSNLQIAITILSPRLEVRSGFLEVPLTLNSPGGILLFSNLLSMTPGSLSTDISSDRKYLRVHLLVMDEEQKVLHEINKIQRRVERIISLL